MNLQEATLVHLTRTGVHAGRPLCEVDKQQAITRGEAFAHAMYAPLNHPAVKYCAECLAVWNEDDSE